MSRAATCIEWLSDALACSHPLSREDEDAARDAALEASPEDAHVIGVLMHTLILAQRNELAPAPPSTRQEARAARAALHVVGTPSAPRAPALARAVEALLAARWDRARPPEPQAIRRAARAAAPDDREYLDHLMRAA